MSADADINNPTIQWIPYPDYYYVYAIGGTIMQTTLLCCSWIIWRVYKIYKRKKSLSTHLRFPMYMAVTDLLLYIGHMNNQAGLSCAASAAYVAFGVFLNMSYVMQHVTSRMTAFVAINSYLTLCRGTKIDFGTADWKMWAVCCTFALTLGLAGASQAGPSDFWCYFQQSGSKAFAWITVITEVTLFNTSLFCFYFVLQVVYSVKPIVVGNFANTASQMTEGAKSSTSANKTLTAGQPKKDALKDNYEKLKRTATRKTMSYLLCFFIQWGGAVPYIVGNLFDYHPTWVYVLTNISINSGGMLNMLAFGLNEGWTDQALPEPAAV
ncbi:hypothetical protein HDV03_003655 [Kappamyces sp. JEL0829]|nr:hypothetical protein HDV03_003655 [Kappamyces sp. JEL0829]